MKKTLFFLLFSFCATSLSAQTERAWTAVSGKNVKTAKNVARLSFPKDYQLFELNDQTLRQALQNAPQRDFTKKNQGVVIAIPNTDGQIEHFKMVEASNFEPDLQAQFPDIRAYVGKGVEDPSATLRMSVDPRGVSTMVLRVGKPNEFMERYSEDGKIYAVFNSSRDKSSMPFTCYTEDVAIANSLRQSAEAQSPASSADVLLTFRLAMSCNGEYTVYHGGTVPLALAAINASITRVNSVFENDLSIHLSIIAGTTAVIYTNATTDPYTTMANWNNQLQTTLTANIGEANYDVGHMFGASGGGGNAGCIGCVCNTGKGRGITSPADGIPEGDNFDIDYVAHELGHQFGGNHTFSNNVEGTGVNVEPGSGSTIMGYAGITAQDLQPHSDDYFVYASIKQIQDNMATKTCPVSTPVNGVPPVVSAGLDYTIPKSTAFILTGTATDADGSVLNYCWEQNDTATSQTGANSVASPTKTGGPNWRSFNPVATPVRYMPMLSTVLANSLVTTLNGFPQEAASSVARTLNFVLTARDAPFGVAHTQSDNMIVTVNATAGPFLVTSPNTAVSYAAGTNQTVTWDVAGTTGNGVNTAFVDIFLSTNGGTSFPVMLASQVPNDGSEVITIPNTPGTTNRLMIKGYNNIFYDLSNTNFTITAPAATFSVAFSGVAGDQNKTACSGVDVSYTIPYTALGGFTGTTTFSASGQPAGSTVTFSPASVTASGNVTMTISNTAGLTGGFFPITVTASSGATVKTVPLYFQMFSTVFPAITPSSPANMATGQNTTLNLTWSALDNAATYDVQVATDAAFTNIISTGNVPVNSYTVSGLTQGTNYYWRVKPNNTCAAGTYGTAFAFQTGVQSCTTYTATNVPLAISATGTPTVNSTFLLTNNVSISDLNLTVNVTHTWVNDLTIKLISPAGTEVNMVAGPCTSAALNNIVATFDDSGSAIVCGNNPAIGGTVAPVQPLSAFNGQNSAGTWTLRIIDGFNQDGGTLNSWSMNICSMAPLAVEDNHLQDFAIYPNPNNGNFNIQFTPSSTQDIKVNVHDIRGRQIFSRTYQNNGLFNQNLQMEGTASGIYVVTVENGSAKEVKKIVIR
ncbi:MAG: T9SS type A sorting domain-containing protein [Flavobacterium sp.]|uniref:zinc-dependent metalloprotease n=1 Tax=Flavobacterium sp. TaxID=239 RepID=UPI00122647CB|nr:zinc-dependent metalloprotease family protein [Flavobacterium sp.]RZJ66451.1 MAG: T9SS type A sorting domain-containing protein [Flavobacterium sp.]